MRWVGNAAQVIGLGGGIKSITDGNNPGIGISAVVLTAGAVTEGYFDRRFENDAWERGANEEAPVDEPSIGRRVFGNSSMGALNTAKGALRFIQTACVIQMCLYDKYFSGLVPGLAGTSAFLVGAAAAAAEGGVLDGWREREAYNQGVRESLEEDEEQRPARDSGNAPMHPQGLDMPGNPAPTYQTGSQRTQNPQPLGPGPSNLGDDLITQVQPTATNRPPGSSGHSATRILQPQGVAAATTSQPSRGPSTQAMPTRTGAGPAVHTPHTALRPTPTSTDTKQLTILHASLLTTKNTQPTGRRENVRRSPSPSRV